MSASRAAHPAPKIVLVGSRTASVELEVVLKSGGGRREKKPAVVAAPAVPEPRFCVELESKYCNNPLRSTGPAKFRASLMNLRPPRARNGHPKV